MKYGASKQPILTILAQFVKLKNLDERVPFEFNEIQKEKLLNAPMILFPRYKSEPLSNLIVICNEKWIRYDNSKRSE